MVERKGKSNMDCSSCGMKIEKKQRKLACGCGSLLCKKCVQCRDCTIIANDQFLIAEYKENKLKDKEKYSSISKTKVGVGFTSFLLLLLLLSLANAQVLTLNTYNKECVQVPTYYDVSTPVYEDQLVYNSTTDKDDVVSVYVRTDVKQEVKYHEKCSDTITIQDKTIDFKKEGYECKEDYGFTICDSLIDGNGDGKCFDGETCIKIEHYKVSYKNSDPNWNGRSDDIYVKKLEDVK